MRAAGEDIGHSVRRATAAVTITTSRTLASLAGMQFMSSVDG
jgi:hypothetical protein